MLSEGNSYASTFYWELFFLFMFEVQPVVEQSRAGKYSGDSVYWLVGRSNKLHIDLCIKEIFRAVHMPPTKFESRFEYRFFSGRTCGNIPHKSHGSGNEKTLPCLLRSLLMLIINEPNILIGSAASNYVGEYVSWILFVMLGAGTVSTCL